jgi:PTS system nitrogen regulatory IIA component
MASVFLGKLLKPELVKMHLEATTKVGAIREMVSILDQAGMLKDSQAAEEVVLERETIMSTGMERGIAIPHGKTDSVDSLVVALGLKPEGLDFGSADGQPTNILIITLSPLSRTGPHIRFMAEISTLLSNDSLRKLILNAKTSQEVVDLLTKEA